MPVFLSAACHHRRWGVIGILLCSEGPDTTAAQLILEVVGQLQRMFNPDLRMIKKRIEDLISREYIERDPVRLHPDTCDLLRCRP